MNAREEVMGPDGLDEFYACASGVVWTWYFVDFSCVFVSILW